MSIPTCFTSGIKKSLLTPSRPIGLSRKSKPMNSTFNSPLATNSPGLLLVEPGKNFNVTENDVHSNVPLLPVHININKSELRSNNSSPPNVINRSKKRRVIKKESEPVILKSVKSSECLDYLESMSIEQGFKAAEICSDELENLQRKELKPKKEQVRAHSSKRKLCVDTPQKQIKRKLSMKRRTMSSSSDSTETDDDLGLISSNSFTKKEKVVNKNDVSPEQDPKNSESSSINNIIEIEKRVHTKETYLSKLQQVEVYRNLHNVEDLKKLTDIWKSKCEEALRDLLERLKEHGPVDMSILIKKLNVPSNLINYNPEDDVFV